MRAELAAGSVIGGYRLEEQIGRGGMGVVFRAQHPRLGSKVALKLLSIDLAEEEAFRERFALESQLASSLHHPNILPVHDAGEADGWLYLAMRLVEGPSLRDLIAKESLEPERALALLSQVASALDAAHANGLIHRDVKPGNVLVAKGGATQFGEHAYLTDFGVSKQLGSSAHLTSTGQLVGTLHYVAPEQIAGNPVDGRCDQYALGCMLYECLTGSPPFAPKGDLTLLWAHMHDPPPRVGAVRAGLGPAIDEAIARMLAKSPQDRYATCAEAIAAAGAALGPAVAGGPPAARRRRSSARRRFPVAAVVGGAGVAAGAVGIALLVSGTPAAEPGPPPVPPGVSYAVSAGEAAELELAARAQASPQRRRPTPVVVRRPNPSPGTPVTTPRPSPAPSRPAPRAPDPAPPPIPPVPP